jgi:hypothetical protein
MYLTAQQLSSCVVQPVHFTREEVQELCPWLIRLDDETLAHRHYVPHYSPLARACLASEGHVAPLLDYALTPARPVLIIGLPPSFEEHLDEAACQAPAPYWTTNSSLTRATALVCWEAPNNAWPFSFSIDGEMHSELLSWLEPRLPGQRLDFPSRRQTVIMVSGNSVVVGGFWLTENNLYAAAACDAAVASWNPLDDHTPEEVATAIAETKAASMEWFGLNALYEYDDGRPGFTLAGYCDVRQDPIPNYGETLETSLLALAGEEDI